MDFNRGKFVSPLFALLLFISFAGLCGCATLPTVSEMIDTVPVIDEPPQIVSAGGLLSNEESRAIMERLKGPGAPIDILQRHIMTFVLYISALTFAGKSVHMTNAYFVPDNQILTALTDAAQRGVDVRIVLPKVSIHPTALYAGQYYYSVLLRSGVKLYERRNATLHAKTAVIDGVWSTVGSTNMDFLSFLRNDEVNTIILNREFAAGMEKMFEADIAESDMILWEEWKERPLWPRITEWFAHLLSSWL